ncbi:hypothetical protein N8D56_24540 [Devosia sp. A8/3-2]|nr:hypothetical protein N8D56_24540 [Devosia sp. A8/3-2]
MSKSEQAAQREQRLAAKLRENLKRRKGQLKARADADTRSPEIASPQIDAAAEEQTGNKP